MSPTATNPPTSAWIGSMTVLPAGQILPSLRRQIPATITNITMMVAQARA